MWQDNEVVKLVDQRQVKPAGTGGISALRAWIVQLDEVTFTSVGFSPVAIATPAALQEVQAGNLEAVA